MKELGNIIYNFNRDNNKELFLSQLKKINDSTESPYKSELNIGFKKIRDMDDMKNKIKTLSEIEEIRDKKILWNEEFINEFYKILWPFIQNLAIGTENFYVFIPEIIGEINRITIKDYIINDCRSTDNYNCGRAMIVLNNLNIISNDNTRLLLFNSNYGKMDENVILYYLYNICAYNNFKKGEENILLSIGLEKLGKYYGRMANRINKEINLLNTNFENVKILDTGKNILLSLRIKDFIIILNLPTTYPNDHVFGVIYDNMGFRTISEVDIEESRDLTNLVNKLVNKYTYFPIALKINCLLD